MNESGGMLLDELDLVVKPVIAVIEEGGTSTYTSSTITDPSVTITDPSITITDPWPTVSITYTISF